MTAMLKASSEAEFDKCVENIHLNYSNQAEVMDKVNEIVGYQSKYAKYLMEKSTGTLNRVSDCAAEQNHSSIAHHLGGACYDDPAAQVNKLLQRQKFQEGIRSQEKANA